MPEMILGLDVGSDTIKAILAARKGRRDVRVMAAEAVRLEEGVDLDAALQALAGKIRPQMSSGARCLVSLPPSDVMFRQIHLPFHDETRIRKTLSFELEPLLPLPIEEVVVDYVHLPDGGLIVAAIGKERIRKIITAVEAHLGMVSVVDIATAALAVPLLDQKSLTGTGILLDIGASSTFAVFYEKNAMVQIRSFVFGGNTITSALAQDLACETGEAERIKIRADYGTKNGLARAFCRQFCVSLKSTVEFMLLNETLHSAPARITVTGGGSLFQPLREELGKTFVAETVDYATSGQLDVDRRLRGTYQPPIMNTALATARRAFAASKSFNFRQGEFVPHSILGSLRTQFKWGAIAAAIVVLLAALSLFLDYRLMSVEASFVKKQISQIFKKHYPPNTVMVDPVAQLKARLEADRKTYAMDSGSSASSVIGLLKEMSGRIPPSLDIVLTHLHYENNLVLVKGEAKKIDDISAVKNELSKSKHFKTVTVGSTSLGKEGARVDFDLRIELR